MYMILYTLLTTHTERDMTNVILTASILYYIGYNLSSGFVTEEYNYIGIAAIALFDLYMSNGILQGTSRPTLRAPKAPKAAKKASRKASKELKPHGRRVRFNPNTSIYTYPTMPIYQYPQHGSGPGINPGMMAVPPRYIQAQHQHQHQSQQQQQQRILIDNRDIADELESNSSDSSIESIAVSDTISWSSEDN